MLDLKLIYFEFIIDCASILLSLVIFTNIRQKHKSFIILPISIILLFLMDIQYLIVYYFNVRNGFILYECITYSWYLITISGLLSLLIRFVYGKKESYLLFASFIFVTVVIIFFFSPNFIKYLHYPYYSIELSSHITIFYLCILLIIATQNKYVLLAISGLCIAEIGNFAMTECYLQDNHGGLVYGEFCWLIGTFTLLIGMFNIIRDKLYNPDIWFFNSTTIRNKFSFLIFTISIWSFIIACIVMKEFSKITDNSLVFIPAIGMFYSMITAVFSVIISKQMEKPFTLIQEQIQFLFSGDKTYSAQKFNLIEFQKLNNFIVESYEYKTSLEKHIVSMATRIAHDIRSPLQIIENLIKNQNDNDDQSFQEQFLKQINKISYISKSLLNENKKIIEYDSYGCQSLYCIVEDLISDKQIEWSTGNSIIDFEYTPNQIIWLNNEHSKIKIAISNVLNNAFEASTSNSINIKLMVNLENSKLIIYVQDFGCGISEQDINDIFGKSLKINGNGIGLSAAKEFMTSIHGTLTVRSNVSEFNHGSTFKFEMPYLSFSEQFATRININTKKIIIVDDDTNIINFWQEYFLFNANNHEVSYFLNFSSLKNHLSKETNNEITHLLDYSILGEKITGIDIIKEFNLKNVYLITNYAEDVKLQDEIKSLPLKLVPKTMLHIMLKNQAISTTHL